MRITLWITFISIFDHIKNGTEVLTRLLIIIDLDESCDEVWGDASLVMSQILTIPVNRTWLIILVHTYTRVYVSIWGDICSDCGKCTFENQPATNKDSLEWWNIIVNKLRVDHAYIFPSLPMANYNTRENTQVTF